MPHDDASGGQVTGTPTSETGGAHNRTAVEDWLFQVGLGEANLFARWDAAQDPDLSTYLVRHDVFRTLWHDSPAVVLAPAGGGKSAFRVRLTYAARVGEDGRRVFAIPYTAPDPEALSLEAHLADLLWSAALELLLALVYQPTGFEALDEAEQARVRRILDHNAPGVLDYYLPEIRRAKGLAPLVDAFAPAAAHLPKPAAPEQVKALCDSLQRIPSAGDAPPLNQRFQELVRLLLDELSYEAVYVLVDGVDAYQETMDDPDHAIRVLAPLLEQVDVLGRQRVFLKFFLPAELEASLPELTESTRFAKIEWKPKSLIEVLRARLRAASGGEFDSLDAISAPSLRDAESELIAVIPPIPRELLVLANQVIEEHVQRTGRNGDLEPEDGRLESEDDGLEFEDVQAAIESYHSPQVSSP